MSKRVSLAVSALILLLAGTVTVRGDFPAGGVDSFPTKSVFSVTIIGPTCPAPGRICTGTVTDPATTVGRSNSIASEAGEGAVPVPVGPCPGPGCPAGVCTACTNTAGDPDCFPVGSGKVPEVHTEMLSLRLCGPCTCGTCCYLAGQPAHDALATPPSISVGQYQNSYGEVESVGGGGFPATSYWSIHTVVTVDPGTCGTSGVFYTGPGTPVEMSSPLGAFPPKTCFTSYNNVGGSTTEGGGGAACGLLPVPIFDAQTGGAGGQINSGAIHDIGDSCPSGTIVPAVSPWMAGLLVLALPAAFWYLSRRRNRMQSI